MIKEVVIQRRMPPWHADPRYGKFTNDRRLTQDEIDKLVEWTDDGTPMGDKAELPAAPRIRPKAGRSASPISSSSSASR